MKPYPIRLPESLLADLEAEADEEGLGTAEYIRRILRQRDSTQDSTQPSTQPSTQEYTARLDELQARIETLEDSAAHRADRLEALEAQHGSHESGGETPEGPNDESPVQTEDSLSGARGASQDTPDAGDGESRETGGAESPPSSVRELLKDWRPGQGREDRERRREVGAAVLEALRDDGPMKAADFKADLYPEHAVGDENADSWWERTAREAINHARDAGVVKLQNSKEYEWVGR